MRTLYARDADARDIIESNCNHARMRAMRTLYARDTDQVAWRRDAGRPERNAVAMAVAAVTTAESQVLDDLGEVPECGGCVGLRMILVDLRWSGKDI